MEGHGHVAVGGFLVEGGSLVSVIVGRVVWWRTVMPGRAVGLRTIVQWGVHFEACVLSAIAAVGTSYAVNPLQVKETFKFHHFTHLYLAEKSWSHILKPSSGRP